MALTKAQVREILSAAGVDSEHMSEAVEKIIDGHLVSVNALREEIGTYKAESEKLPALQKELEAAQADLAASKKDSWEVKYKAVPRVPFFAFHFSLSIPPLSIPCVPFSSRVLRVAESAAVLLWNRRGCKGDGSSWGRGKCMNGMLYQSCCGRNPVVVYQSRLRLWLEAGKTFILVCAICLFTRKP